MLRTLKDLEGYKIRATDGDVGSVVNFLLDDEHWTVRYLVAQTGAFFDRARRLIPVISFRRCDWSTRHFHVSLSADKVLHAPSVDTDKPVSRQHERDQLRYYGRPSTRAHASHAAGNAHLRSAHELHGYHVHGSDGTLGHVEDFIVDDETWQIRYLVVDTSVWWLGRRVLIAPQWASRVSWAAREVHLSISQKMIKDSPEWNATAPISREYEARLYDHYGRPVHWKNGKEVAL